MKKMICVLLAVCLVLGVAAATAADNAFDPLGTWTVALLKDANGEYDPAELGVNFRFTLNADGTVTTQNLPNPAELTWTLENDVLSLRNENENSTMAFTIGADGQPVMGEAGGEQMFLAREEAAFDPVGVWTVESNNVCEESAADADTQIRFTFRANGTAEVSRAGGTQASAWAATATEVSLPDAGLTLAVSADGKLRLDENMMRLFFIRTGDVEDAAPLAQHGGAFNPVGEWRQLKQVQKFDGAELVGDEIPAHRRYTLVLNADGSAQIAMGDILHDDAWALEQKDGAPLITFANMRTLKLQPAEDEQLVADAGPAYLYFGRVK